MAIDAEDIVLTCPAMTRGRRTAHKLTGTLTALALLLSAATAAAITDEERAGARAAASAGADAFDQGRFKEAIDFFRRAESLIHSPVHLLYIGRAQLKLGEWVRARETFLKIRREGAPAGASPGVKRAVESANAELQKLEPKLPYVTISLEGASASEAKTTVDGHEIPTALVGIPRPVDPGKHVFRAKAGGLDSGDVSVVVEEGKRQTITLKLKPATAAEAEPAAPVDSSGPAETASPAEPAPTSSSSPAPVSTSSSLGSEDLGTSSSGSSGMRIASYAALGVGVAGVAVGTIFGLQSKSKADEADDLCGGNRESCEVSPGTPVALEVQGLNDDAGSAQTVSLIGFGAGIVGLGVGATLFILSLDDDGESASSGANRQTADKPRITPFIGYKSAGIFGTF